MFPSAARNTHRKPALRQQRGFLLPVAVFILVAMSLFALALSRNVSRTGLAVVQEVISTQAFNAAESGAQRGMGELFAGGDDAALADAACTAMNRNDTFNTTGLNNCSAAVTCALTSTTAASLYALTSVGQCGSGQTAATRTIRVDAYLEVN